VDAEVAVFGGAPDDTFEGPEVVGRRLAVEVFRPPGVGAPRGCALFVLLLWAWCK